LKITKRIGRENSSEFKPGQELRVLYLKTKNEMGKVCSAYRGGETCTGFLWENLTEKRPLGRPRHRWEDNIKMDIQEVGYECMGWIELAQDRDMCRALVNEVMNLRVP
jgi:hypothetical protein